MRFRRPGRLGGLSGLLVVEDRGQIMLAEPAGLEGAGETRLGELVKQALRMRPSRIIVGEVRAEECLDLSNGSCCRGGAGSLRW